MATTLSRYLRLKLDSNLTANAKYNLERIDALGSTFITDSSNSLNIRSEANIAIEPNSADIGGTGTGGEVSVGTLEHTLDSFDIYATLVNFSNSVGLLDSGTSGTKYLRMKYDSTLSGSVDTTADRNLTFDLNGADRSVILGGNYSQIGGALALTLSGNSTLSAPLTGTLATLLGIETFQNKSIDADLNTLTNISNSAIKAAAGIVYSKLNLSGSVATSDLSPSLLVPISLGGTGQVTANAALNALLPTQSGQSGKVLSSDGTNSSWIAAGVGSVTSVDFAAPAEFSVSGNPITTAGTITLSKANQSANTIWAGPTSGSPTAPGFRSLGTADLPAIAHSSLTGLSNDDHTQYHTDARALTWLGTRSTTDLPEGTNLYYTASRFDTAFSGKSTSDLTEGTNLYYTATRFNTAFSGKSTTDLTEGSNLYYTAARFNTAFSGKSTTDLTEGTNLYYTSARFDTAFSGKSTTNLSEGTNLYYTAARFNTAFAAKSTTDLAEGSNLYFTTARVDTQVATYKVLATWATGDGTTKAVTHNLGTTDISWNIYEIDTGEELWPDTGIRTNSNTLTFTASSAPTGSGWKIIIRK